MKTSLLQQAQIAQPYKLVTQRLLLMLLGSILTYVILTSTHVSTGIPPISGLYIMLPNVIGFITIWRIHKQHSVSLREYVGYRPGKLWRDIGWSILWLVATYVPFAAVMYLSIWVLFGANFVDGIQWLMVPQAVTMASLLNISIAIISGVLFVINAPV